LSPVVENAIYRIVQEGVTNAWKHSKSDKVRVTLAQRGDQVRIEIRDWGVGFAVEEVQDDRFGLEGVRERARLLGGSATLNSAPGSGTRLIVKLPITDSAADATLTIPR
jgi:signal transduction histidine kinase